MARLYGFVFTYWGPKNTPIDEREANVNEWFIKLRGVHGTAGIKYMVYGMERGDNPTDGITGGLHLQGYLQCNTDKKARLYKAVGAAVNPQKGTAEQAANYCKKDGNFIEVGDFNDKVPGMKKSGQRSDLEAIQNDIRGGMTYEEICDVHFGEVAKFNRFIKEQILLRNTNKELDSLREAFSSASLRPWQEALVAIVQEAPNPRRIHWIWEDQGNTGKSWMTKYLAAMHQACIMTVGKKADMSYLYSKNPSKVVVFDLSRTTEPGEGREHFLDGAYSLAEDLKNGMVTSYKYDSANVLTTGCHVIFFANFLPDMTKWSADRYAIKRI